ncbi:MULTISPECIES: hypothetical protein [Mangrovibacter]|uniref:Uncharacterized protein n=1 Tax=Mangrovibacter plantisponsor TaxID=451513 RepID=A0A317PZY6_9ENTR|nr:MULTISPECIES: hypothetical protein [Mangrovibacter]KEA53402.1 hypothetical protein DT73_08570 [Mangrovibacter sp. MFB070]PWW09198.1 hypothetical protein DES37_106322 [Mangrovibacter plantisponsor]
MPVFIFLKKGGQITVVEKADATEATRLKAQGYEQQFEEITAPNAAKALARFRDIKQDEESIQHGFSTGAAFISLLVVLMFIISFFLQR